MRIQKYKTFGNRIEKFNIKQFLADIWALGGLRIRQA